MMAEHSKPPSGYPPPGSYPASSNGYSSGAYPPPPYHPPPPPPQPHQAYYYGPVSGGYSSSKYFQRLLIFLIAVFLIFGALTLIVWLAFRPQLPDFSVTGATVSGFNLTGNQLTANWDVNITAYNGNKKIGVNYKYVTASVSYGKEALARTSLAPFDQEKLNTTIIRARLATNLIYVSDWTASQLKSARNDGRVYFDIQLLSAAQFKSGGWLTRGRTLRIFCDGVEIDWAGSGNNATIGRLNSLRWCAAYL